MIRAEVSEWLSLTATSRRAVISRSLPRKALMARSLRHARRRKPHPEISIYQCAHGRIAVRIFLAQPAVDNRYARRSRGKGHAFAEDCAIIRDGQVQTRRETMISTGTSTQTIQGADLTQNTWYRAEARREASNQVEGTLWSDAHALLGEKKNVTLTSSISNTEYPYLRSGDGHDVETDWILVRRFEDAEPAFSSVGAEETGGFGTTTMLQNISYTYDGVGNITQITDRSDTGAGKSVTFGYDDLHRLTLASTTAASSTPYRNSFGYSAIGNITGFSTTSGATTTYFYAGTNFANPHAATAIGSTTHTYDNNGNLTAASPWSYTWDYRNRLTQAAKGTATSTTATKSCAWLAEAVRTC